MCWLIPYVSWSEVFAASTMVLNEDYRIVSACVLVLSRADWLSVFVRHASLLCSPRTVVGVWWGFEYCYIAIFLTAVIILKL